MSHSRRPAAHPSPRPVALAQPRSEVARRLQQRIKLGKDIQALPIRSQGEIQAYKKEAKRWREYNRTLLKTVFTDNSVDEEYQSGGFGILTFDEDAVFHLFRENVDWDIEKLESIV